MQGPEAIPDDVRERALRRLVRRNRDIGAAIWADITEPDLVGRAFRTAVTDGETFAIVDWVDDRAPRRDLLAEPIEDAVEDRVCRICPDDDRMPVLRALVLWFENGRIPIRLGPEAVAEPELAKEPEAAEPLGESEEPERRAA